MPIAKSTKLKSGSISGNQKDKYINRVRFFEADESIGQRITLFVPGNNIGVATAEVGRIACKAQSAPEFSAFESPQALRASPPSSGASGVAWSFASSPFRTNCIILPRPPLLGEVAKPSGFD